MQRQFICSLLAIQLIFCISGLQWADAQSPERQDHPASLVSLCERFYETCRPSDESAVRSMLSNGRTIRRKQLMDALHATQPGTDGYAAVAFVMALDGMDIQANITRMMETYRATMKQHDPSSLMSEPVVLKMIYLRWQDNSALRAFLEMRGDGILGETLSNQAAFLLHRYPYPVLQVATEHNDYLSHLALDLSEGTFTGDTGISTQAIVRLLKRMCHNRDRNIAHAANYCLTSMITAQRKQQEWYARHHLRK